VHIIVLAKDHFNQILNEPAGQIARIIVRHVVQGVVKAWDDNSINAQQMVEQFLDVIHHPFFQNGNPLQREMLDHMRTWINAEDKGYTLNALTKEAVRAHKNHRKGHATEEPSHGPGGYTSFLPTPASIQSQATNYVHQQAQHIPGYNQFNQVFPGSGGRRDYDDRGNPLGGSSPYTPTGAYTGPVLSQPSAYPSHDPASHHNPHQGQSSYPAQYSDHHAGHGMTQELGYPGQGGHAHGYGHPPPPPGPGGFGGPSAHGPPGWEGGPPHHQDGYSGNQSGVGYPGAEFQQHHGQPHHGPPHQQQPQYGAPNQWSNQPPPSGRW
jgi:hypothetical protein